MNKFLKFAVAVVVLVAVIVVAQGGAWAAKVNDADAAPVAAVDSAGVAAARPVGTVSNVGVSVAGGGAAVHQAGFQGNLPREMRSGAPDGTVFVVNPNFCGTDGLYVEFATGPNWSGVVSYWNGGAWISIAPQGENGEWTVTVPCSGMTYLIISPAGY